MGVSEGVLEKLNGIWMGITDWRKQRGERGDGSFTGAIGRAFVCAFSCSCSRRSHVLVIVF